MKNRPSLTHCQHPRVVVLGSEETGVRAIHCEECNRELDRRVSRDGRSFEYVLSVNEGAPVA